MNLEEIEKARQQIIIEKDEDDEAAHILEDNLREDFIKHVSKCEDEQLAEMAKLILSIKDIEFIRWHS